MNEIPQKPTNDQGMTDLEWKFVNEYLIDFNGTAAAKRAGVEKYHSQRASELLKRPRVRELITVLLEERNQRWECTRERVIQELVAVAFSNIKDYCSWSNQGVRLFESDDLTRDQAASIIEVKQTDTERGRHIAIKREPKSKVLELLMKHLGLIDPVGDDSNRGAFAKWADEQRKLAEEDSERESLQKEIAELREQVAAMKRERREDDETVSDSGNQT